MWINEELRKENDIGFIYIITNKLTEEFYIGKKNLISYKTIKKKKVYSESNWKNYYGSNDYLKKIIKEVGKENFERKILMFCDTKIKLTYFEVDQQIKHNWLSVKCLNNNILGKFYKRNLQNFSS